MELNVERINLYMMIEKKKKRKLTLRDKYEKNKVE